MIFDESNNKFIKPFVMFLLKYDLYTRFLYYFNKLHLNTNTHDEYDLIYLSFINLAFDWAKTNEGIEFWQTIDNKWVEYIVDYIDTKLETYAWSKYRE